MAAIPIKPTYFLAPNCDFLPTSPCLALGSLITDPAKPERTINKNSRVIIPEEDITSSFKNDWQDTVRKLRASKLTIWASFLQSICGVGGDISGSNAAGTEEVYKFKTLQTKFFTPDEEFIAASLAATSVKIYLKATRWKKPIYMVTGVKIAIGARVTGKMVVGQSIGVKLGLDGTPLGVPVSVGPTLETLAEKSQDVKFGSSSDYVFAYRLRKIKIKKNGSVVETEHTKGALFGVEKWVESEDGYEWEVEEIGADKGIESETWASEAVYDDEDSDNGEICLKVHV